MHSEPPDRELDAEEQQRIAELTADQLRAIDDALLDLAHIEWRKVAYVVAFAMTNADRVREVPDIYYAQRVRALVEDGKLEAQGFLDRMRYSEVRLPADPGLQRR